MANTGGQAFPRPHSECTVATTGSCVESQPGMTLRDYFAAKAMQAYLAAPDSTGERARDDAEAVAEWAYMNADEMLKARKK